MQQFVLRRLALSVPTLLGIAILVFFSLRLMPGDVVDVLQGLEPTMTNEQAETLRRVLGLGKPLHEQFWGWAGATVQGDLGESFYSERSVAGLIKARLPISLQLGMMSFAIGILLAFPLGIISALRPNTLLDYVVRTFSVFSLAAPNYWLAIIALLVLSKWLHWSPPVQYSHITEDPVANMEKMILPSLILGTGFAGALARYLRSALLEVLRQDYIVTARSKGLTERVVVWRHALKNAFIPVLTVIGLYLAAIVGGSVIMEQIFTIPGTGFLLLQAIFQRDYPIVQGVVLVIAASYVYINIFVDVLYAYADPRIRYS
jgi:peptide/nickel transport system permease protein